MVAQLNQILQRNKKKTKRKEKRTYLRKPTKSSGGCLQNLQCIAYLAPVATARVARPPPDADAVHPEPPRARIRLPRTSSLCSRTSRSRSRSASPTNPNPSYAAPPLELRRRLAGVAGHHCSIAWASSCASSSSTSSPSHASRDAAVSSSSSFYRRYLRRSSSSIPATASLPVLHRPLRDVRGEQAKLLEPSSLSIAFCAVA